MDRKREDTYCSVSVCTWLRFCSEILQDWSKGGGLGNSLILTRWQNRSGQGNKALTYQCVLGICSCSSQLLNQAVTSSPGLLSTGQAALSFLCLFSATSSSNLYRMSQFPHVLVVRAHNAYQNWQEMTATQKECEMSSFLKGWKGEPEVRARKSGAE